MSGNKHFKPAVLGQEGIKPSTVPTVVGSTFGRPKSTPHKANAQQAIAQSMPERRTSRSSGSSVSASASTTGSRRQAEFVNNWLFTPKILPRESWGSLGDGWWQVTPTGSGLTTRFGLHSVIESAYAQSFMCLYEPRSQEASLACLSATPEYNLEIHAKIQAKVHNGIISKAHQNFQIVFAFKNPFDYCSVRCDAHAQVWQLIHTIGTEDVLIADVEDGGIRLHTFYNLLLQIRCNSVSLDVNTLPLFTNIRIPNLDNVGGLMGLVSKGTRFAVKGWRLVGVSGRTSFKTAIDSAEMTLSPQYPISRGARSDSRFGGASSGGSGGGAALLNGSNSSTSSIFRFGANAQASNSVAGSTANSSGHANTSFDSAELQAIETKRAALRATAVQASLTGGSPSRAMSLMEALNAKQSGNISKQFIAAKASAASMSHQLRRNVLPPASALTPDVLASSSADAMDGRGSSSSYGPISSPTSSAGQYCTSPTNQHHSSSAAGSVNTGAGRVQPQRGSPQSLRSASAGRSRPQKAVPTAGGGKVGAGGTIHSNNGTSRDSYTSSSAPRSQPQGQQDQVGAAVSTTCESAPEHTHTQVSQLSPHHQEHNNQHQGQQQQSQSIVGDGPDAALKRAAHELATRFSHEPFIVDTVIRDVVQRRLGVTFNDIASLDTAKRLLNEAVVLPLIMPEFFTGIREPWKGVLLFGPPGTGKTLLAKAVCSVNDSTFFSCSGSSLISKYRGESEKIVRCLFEAARLLAPAVVFLDEVDAFVSARGDNEHEASRRLKTEFFAQMDGLRGNSNTTGSSSSSGKNRSRLTGEGGNGGGGGENSETYQTGIPAGGEDGNGQVMVLGTTNCPWDLDSAMIRRLEKRIYIPLPDEAARADMLRIFLRDIPISVDVEVKKLAGQAAGFSGSDLKIACKEASMMPMRRLLSILSPSDLLEMRKSGEITVPKVTMGDFEQAIDNTKPSVTSDAVTRYLAWDEEFRNV